MIVTHVISTAVAALFLVAIVPFGMATLDGARARVDAAKRVVIGGVAACGLSAFWLVPYLRYFDERGRAPLWPTDTLSRRVDEIAAGRFVFGHYVALFVVAGWTWALLRGRGRHALYLAPPLAALFFLVVSHWYYAHSPTAELAQQLANRGVGYAAVFAIIPLGGFIDEVLAARISQRWAAALGVIAALLIVVSLPGKPGLRSIPDQLAEPSAEAKTTAAFLKKTVPKGARFATERDFGGEIKTLGFTHPDFWLAAHADRNTSNTYGLEQSQSGVAGEISSNLKNDNEGRFNALAFARFGVTHVVTIEPTARTRMVASGEFRQVFSDGPVAVLEVRPPPDTPRPDSLLAVASRARASKAKVSADAEHYDVTVDAEEVGPASLAIGYSHAWKLRIDGEAAPVTRSQDGLVGFTLPAGRHVVSVDFDRDSFGLLGVLVGVVTAFLLGRWARRAGNARLAPSGP